MDWLQALSNTQRAYRTEAERFLLWAITHKGKALSSMSNEDCIEYRDFLADPQPRSRWCGAWRFSKVEIDQWIHWQSEEQSTSDEPGNKGGTDAD